MQRMKICIYMYTGSVAEQLHFFTTFTSSPRAKHMSKDAPLIYCIHAKSMHCVAMTSQILCRTTITHTHKEYNRTFPTLYPKSLGSSHTS